MLRSLLSRFRLKPDPDQLELSLDPAREFLGRLRRLGLRRVECLTITTNRTVYVSFRGNELRVQKAFLNAPDDVLRAIVVFVCGRGVPAWAHARQERPAPVGEVPRRPGATASIYVHVAVGPEGSRKGLSLFHGGRIYRVADDLAMVPPHRQRASIRMADPSGASLEGYLKSLTSDWVPPHYAWDGFQGVVAAKNGLPFGQGNATVVLIVVDLDARDHEVQYSIELGHWPTSPEVRTTLG